MKRKHFFAIVSVLALTAFGKVSADNFTVKGHVQGLSDGTCVQLVPVSHDREKPLGETMVKDGSFVLTGTVDGPRAVQLMVKDAYGSRYLMLEDAVIEVSGSVKGDSVNGTMSYDLGGLTVTGSPLSMRYDSLLSVRRQADKLYEYNNATYKNATREEREKVDKAFFHTVDSLYHATVMGQKDSFWGPLMMISLTTYLDGKMRPWYDALSDDAKASYYGRKVREEIYPAGAVGRKVQTFMLKDNDGKDVAFDSLCKGKKYILIDFWASWCRPCRKEIPNLKRLYAQYSGKGLEIVSISIDRKKADWQKALEEEQLPWPNFLDVTGVADLYKVRFVPTMYLVDSQGMLVGENLRGEALAKKMAELMPTE